MTITTIRQTRTKARRPHSRGIQSRQLARAAVMATTLSAGAVAMAMMAPHAVADSGSAGALQPVIDQLLGAEQQVVDTSSALPWITSFDLTQAQGYSQVLASTQLDIALSNLTNDQPGDLTEYQPFLSDAPGANPEPFFVITNPDDQYESLSLDPNQTYDITVDPTAGSQDVTFAGYSGDGVSSPWGPTGEVLGLSGATPNADGSYTIVIGPTDPSGIPAGNYLNDAGAQTLLIRDTIGNWGLPHDAISIQEEGVPSAFTAPLLSASQISSLLNTVSTALPIENSSAATYFAQPAKLDTALPANEISPILETAKVTPGVTLPGQLISFGHYSLEPDQALIVSVPNVDAAYSSLQLTNAFGVDAPYVTVQGSLNDTDTFQDPNGYTYYVISDENPGVANWVNDSGINDGIFGIRWQDVTGSVPTTEPTAEVVPVADVSQYLPADYPTVTPDEQAALDQTRLLDFDYMQHQDYGTNWLTTNLEYYQLQNALGATQFNELFGSQQDVPSVLARLTDSALGPNWDTVAQDVVSNPSGSLAAFIGDLPLAAKDIELPMLLAGYSLDVDAEQTALAVQADLASGDLSQMLTDLGTGVQGVETALNDALTDPATSITAGILNAGDDLATGITNAGTSFSLSDYAPLLDSLVQLNQSVFDSADLASLLGADLAPNAGGLLADLLP